MRKITYNSWNYKGRMGNQFFQLASLYGMGRRYDMDVFLPREWKYQDWFSYDIPIIQMPLNPNKDINEPHFHHEWQYWDNKIMESRDEIVSISGWLQSEKYFKNVEKFIKTSLFSFKIPFLQDMKEKWKHVFEKPVILVGIRVGEDYVKNGNYEILPIDYQIGALYKYFPDWKENYNVLVFSDNIEKAKLEMDCHPSIFFAEGTDIEQMALGTLCTHFIIPNSTFSWWQAFLGEKESSIVIHSPLHFKDYLFKISDIKDYYLERWKIYDHRGLKFYLKDVTFTIPLKYDHQDRKDNYDLVVGWLKEHFDTNIMIGEQGGYHFAPEKTLPNHTYVNFFNIKQFHRTYMLNEMAVLSDTPYICNYDVDNICPILQILLAVDSLRDGMEMIYPFKRFCARVPRSYYPLLLENTSPMVFEGVQFRGTREGVDSTTVGHIVFWNKKAFFKAGGENERYISYGPEDVERWQRATKLGVKIDRIKGYTYHIDHYCGPDSSGQNPLFGANFNEYDRTKNMTKEELEKDISTWPWIKKYPS